MAKKQELDQQAGHLQKLSEQVESMERTSVLANERTYAAWVRTGLTSLGGALALDRLLHGALPLHGVRTIALLLVVMSGLFFFLAGWRYCHVANRLASTRVSGAPPLLLIALSILLVAMSLFSVLALLLSSSY